MISEQDKGYREYLARLIRYNRSTYNIYTATKLERVFDYIYSDIEIDIIFFDIEAEKNASNLAIIKAIKPKTRLINWSNCRHPEVIENLYSLGIRTFCLKDSQPQVIFNAIDYINNNQNILYLDKQLNNCLYLLNS
ncbi:MAG: DNA-binding response regulator [Xenococcaceae cyanobacterium MO_188.B29]|nr:DNA-binding response regulator [Xenococcaceae cyanobacterium MO_188.B29]